MPVIVVRKAPGSPPLDARTVRRRAERMVDDLKLSDAELSVLLCDDARIAVMNEAHRKKAKPTDVLAFPMDELGAGPSGKFRLLGDIVISVDTAARQARSRRHALIDEVTHLLAHGLLHLIGYDHRTNSEEREMNAAAARLVGAANGVLLPEESLPRHVRNRR